MSDSLGARYITAEEIFRVPPTEKVVLVGGDGIQQYDFSTDEETIRFAAQNSQIGWAMNMPIGVSMKATYESGDPSQDLILELNDRNVRVPRSLYTAMKGELFSPLTTLVLDPRDIDDNVFIGGFWLNVLNSDTNRPQFKHPTRVSNPFLQTALREHGLRADEVVERYSVLKQKAGKILEYILNSVVVQPV